MGPKQSLSMDLMIRETLCRGNCHPRAFVGDLQSPRGFSTQPRGSVVLTGRSELTVFTHFRTCEGWNGSRAQMVCWHTFCHLIHLASLHTEMHWQRGEMLGCYWFKKRNAFEQLLYRELGTREREWRSVSVTQRQSRQRRRQNPPESSGNGHRLFTSNWNFIIRIGFASFHTTSQNTQV